MHRSIVHRISLVVLAAGLTAAPAFAQSPAPIVTRPPAPGSLTLRDAVQRGLEFNLGVVNIAQVVKQAHSQRTIARSALLPNIVGEMTAAVQELNLAAQGLNFFDSPIPGFSIPTINRYHYVDFRARLSQNVLDMASLNTYRSAGEAARATELSADDTRDLVVQAVGGAYLQVIAARARVESARSQLETANTLFEQTSQRKGVGLVAQVDVDRSQIQALTLEHRLTTLQNELAKQKIDLVQMIGLQPTDRYELADEVPFSPAADIGLEDALRQAREGRSDLRAAEAQLRSAERALSAAHAERLPTVSVNADYGAIGAGPLDAQRTFALVGRVRVPIWQGGHTDGDIARAESVLAQRHAELDDLSTRIEGEVQKAYLDLQAAGSQVDLSQKNVGVTRSALDLTRQRFDAGVSDNVEVVQAQELVAVAAFDYINSVFSHNLSKLNLARAMGQAAERLPDFLKLP